MTSMFITEAADDIQFTTFAVLLNKTIVTGNHTIAGDKNKNGNGLTVVKDKVILVILLQTNLA